MVWGVHWIPPGPPWKQWAPLSGGGRSEDRAQLREGLLSCSSASKALKWTVVFRMWGEASAGCVTIWCQQVEWGCRVVWGTRAELFSEWRLQCRCDCWSQSHKDGWVPTPTAGRLPRQHFSTHNMEGGEWEANAETVSKLLRSTQRRRDGVDTVWVQSPTFPPSRTHKFPTLSDEEIKERPDMGTLISLKCFSFSQKGTFFPTHTKRPPCISGLWLYTLLSNYFLNIICL